MCQVSVALGGRWLKLVAAHQENDCDFATESSCLAVSATLMIWGLYCRWSFVTFSTALKIPICQVPRSRPARMGGLGKLTSEMHFLVKEAPLSQKYILGYIVKWILWTQRILTTLLHSEHFFPFSDICSYFLLHHLSLSLSLIQMVIVTAYFHHSYCQSQIKIKYTLMHASLSPSGFYSISLVSFQQNILKETPKVLLSTSSAVLHRPTGLSSHTHPSVSNTGWHAIPHSHKHKPNPNPNPNEKMHERMTTPSGLS